MYPIGQNIPLRGSSVIELAKARDTYPRITPGEQFASLLYMVAMNEYDEYSSANANTNKIDVSISRFKELVNHPSCGTLGVFLLLNKSDMFLRKICDAPYRVVNGPEQRNVDFEGPLGLHLSTLSAARGREWLNAAATDTATRFKDTMHDQNSELR